MLRLMLRLRGGGSVLVTTPDSSILGRSSFLSHHNISKPLLHLYYAGAMLRLKLGRGGGGSVPVATPDSVHSTFIELQLSQATTSYPQAWAWTWAWTWAWAYLAAPINPSRAHPNPSPNPSPNLKALTDLESLEGRLKYSVMKAQAKPSPNLTLSYTSTLIPMQQCRSNPEPSPNPNPHFNPKIN